MITGTFGRSAFTLGSISRPVMPGMLMSESTRIRDRLHLFQRGRRRQSKFHHEAPLSQIPPEVLLEHPFDVRFVIDDNNVSAQFVLPWGLCADTARGSVMMNSVNAPSSVITRIVPPCCFTMMSWLMERPSPVPSPAGLVVKNGLNIFSLISEGTPAPLSRIRISTEFPRLFVAASRVGSNPASPSLLRLVAA